MTKKCFNPNCQRSYETSHYGDRQIVCGGTYEEKCRKCPGKGCKRCRGAGTFMQPCLNWLKGYYSRMRKRPRRIPEPDMKAIIAEVREFPFWSSLFIVASWSALRKGELLGLLWSDVLEDGKVRSVVPIRGQWSDGEGFKEMKVGEGKYGYILEPARKALQALFSSAKSEPGFPNVRVWATTEANAWKRFIAVQKRLGIKNPDTGREYRFHDLRHTSILKTYHATRDLNKARELAGHKSLATTTIYATERPEEFMEGLEGAFKRGNGRH